MFYHVHVLFSPPAAALYRYQLLYGFSYVHQRPKQHLVHGVPSFQCRRDFVLHTQCSHNMWAFAHSHVPPPPSLLLYRPAGCLSMFYSRVLFPQTVYLCLTLVSVPTDCLSMSHSSVLSPQTVYLCLTVVSCPHRLFIYVSHSVSCPHRLFIYVSQ